MRWGRSGFPFRRLTPLSGRDRSSRIFKTCLFMHLSRQGGPQFALEYITRDDIASLTREASEVSDIQYVMDLDGAEVDEILEM